MVHSKVPEACGAALSVAGGAAGEAAAGDDELECAARGG